jgi:hypothetical protein
VSDLAEAWKALAEGRRDDALVHAWNAARRASDNERDLKEVARLADELGDAPLAAAVAVRRLRGGAPRMSVPRWSAFRDQSIVFAIGFLWWLGWSSLIAFAFIDDALLAMVPATVAAVLMMVALTIGWLQTDD